jgi:hypothetical protein
MLYAAVLDRRIRGVALEGLLVSYDWVVRHQIHRQIFEDVVPGALKSFDLPDMVSSLAPRSVWIVNAVNGLGHPMPIDQIHRPYARAERAFEAAGAGQQMHITERRPGDAVAGVYGDLVQAAAR